MISDKIIKEQLKFTLKETSFDLGEKYTGKVRDVYKSNDRLIIVVSDRLSAFDKVLTTLPFKGQVLNQVSAFWFDKTKDIIQNHVISIPDPQVMEVRKVKILPIEVVIRGYLTGSAWRDYNAGKKISGIKLKEGLKKDQKFDVPLFTPSTKEEHGKHDEPISEEEIVKRNILPKKMLDEIKSKALALFERGTQICAKQGLILVDTKYEFGVDEKGKLVLADEIHTPDSSRFWYSDTYRELFQAQKDQRMLDKEYLRQWLIKEKNFMGDGPIPTIPDNIRIESAKKYIKAYEEITGMEFKPETGDVTKRIMKNLKIR